MTALYKQQVLYHDTSRQAVHSISAQKLLRAYSDRLIPYPKPALAKLQELSSHLRAAPYTRGILLWPDLGLSADMLILTILQSVKAHDNST